MCQSYDVVFITCIPVHRYLQNLRHSVHLTQRQLPFTTMHQMLPPEEDYLDKVYMKQQRVDTAGISQELTIYTHILGMT